MLIRWSKMIAVQLGVFIEKRQEVVGVHKQVSIYLFLSNQYSYIIGLFFLFE